MKFLLIAIYALWVTASSAEVFRLSLVEKVGAEHTENLSLRENGVERVYAVSKDIILTEKEVTRAGPVLQPDSLELVLTDKGAEQLSEKLKDVKIGEDRMAFIVQGKLIAAPIIRGSLGKSFVISGFEGNDVAATQKFADLIMGRTTAKIESAAVDNKHAQPYTDEEYQQLKESRQKQGRYYLDQLLTEAALKKTLTIGLTVDQVKEIFGPPTRQREAEANGTFQIEYELAPERLPQHDLGKMIPNVVVITFENKQLHSWHVNMTTALRKLNEDKNRPSTLKMQAPSMQDIRGAEQLLAYLEKIKIIDPDQQVNQHDLHRLLTLVLTVNQSLAGEGKQTASLSAECDVMKFLCKHYQPMAQLVATQKEGRIPMADVSALAEKLLNETK